MTLTVNLHTHPLPARVDPVHLQQVLLNLVLNAMDATAGPLPDERRVTIRTAGINNDTVKVSIADSGAGIPADKLQQIFEPFFTTKEKGMGFGLAIARTIIERSGGEISAENRPQDRRRAFDCHTVLHQRAISPRAGRVPGPAAMNCVPTRDIHSESIGPAASY